MRSKLQFYGRCSLLIYRDSDETEASNGVVQGVDDRCLDRSSIIVPHFDHLQEISVHMYNVNFANV